MSQYLDDIDTSLSGYEFGPLAEVQRYVENIHTYYDDFISRCGRIYHTTISKNWNDVFRSINGMMDTNKSNYEVVKIIFMMRIGKLFLSILTMMCIGKLKFPIPEEAPPTVEEGFGNPADFYQLSQFALGTEGKFPLFLRHVFGWMNSFGKEEEY